MTDAAEPEFSYVVKCNAIGAKTESLKLSANAEQRKALAKRFDLAGLDHMHATFSLKVQGEHIQAGGRLTAKLSQYCVISNEELPVTVDEPISIRFEKGRDDQIEPDEEIELASEDCDVQFYEGEAIDVGEAISQSLVLALDPYPRSPNADKVAEKAGLISESEAGPFAALKSLKDQLTQK